MDFTRVDGNAKRAIDLLLANDSVSFEMHWAGILVDREA